MLHLHPLPYQREIAIVFKILTDTTTYPGMILCKYFQTNH